MVADYEKEKTNVIGKIIEVSQQNANIQGTKKQDITKKMGAVLGILED